MNLTNNRYKNYKQLIINVLYASLQYADSQYN